MRVSKLGNRSKCHKCKICCNQKLLNATKVTRFEFLQTSF